MDELILRLQSGVDAVQEAQRMISSLESANENYKVIIHRLIQKHDVSICTEKIDEIKLEEIRKSTIIIDKDNNVKFYKPL